MLAEAKAQAKELICCEPHEGESGVSYMRSRLAIREVAVSLGDNWYSIFWGATHRQFRFHTKIKFTRLFTSVVPKEGASVPQSLSLEQGHPDPVAVRIT